MLSPNPASPQTSPPKAVSLHALHYCLHLRLEAVEFVLKQLVAGLSLGDIVHLHLDEFDDLRNLIIFQVFAGRQGLAPPLPLGLLSPLKSAVLGENAVLVDTRLEVRKRL